MKGEKNALTLVHLSLLLVSRPDFRENNPKGLWGFLTSDVPIPAEQPKGAIDFGV